MKFNIYNLIVEVTGMQLPPDMHRDRLLTRGPGGFTLAKTLRGGQDAETQRNCGPLGMTAGGLGGLAALRALLFFLLAKKLCS
jgi:hypothetical protein